MDQGDGIRTLKEIVRAKIWLLFLIIIAVTVVVWNVRTEAVKREELEAKQRAAKQDIANHQTAFDLVLNGASLYFEEYVRLESDDPEYYRVMSDESSFFELSDRWSAIENARLNAISYTIADIGTAASGCDTDSLCRSSGAVAFFDALQRAAQLNLDGVSAWHNGNAYDGNELLNQAREFLDTAGKKLSEIFINYSTWISVDQSSKYRQLSDEASTSVAENYLRISSYCDSINPEFHTTARYKNTCASSDDSDIFTLNTMSPYYYSVPIKFIGRISRNAKSITVTAVSGDHRDEYRLKNFKPGDRSFQYQASAEWNNLLEGRNTYYFVAKFSDGTTRTETAEFYYFPL